MSCTGATTCTGIDANCWWERGYVQCGSTTIYCPRCPCVPPTGCFGTCQVNSDCDAQCCGEYGACVTGCDAQKPLLKRCRCIF